MKYNLSEITEIIRQRRSITPEQFAPRKVHREQLEVVLNNALWAPSHGMTQPWRFKVFTEGGMTRLQQFVPELYRKTTAAEKFNQAKFDRMSLRLEKTTVVVALCMERDPTGKIDEIEEIEAVACAAQNMMLTCTAYGLGGFWSTPKLIYTEQMNTFLGIDEKDKCLGLFYIGYPAIEWPASHRIPLEYHTQWLHE